jgi:hypothetical protein
MLAAVDVMASRSTIRGNIEFVGTVLVADPISVRVSHLIDVPSLGDVNNLGHCASLSAEEDWPTTYKQQILSPYFKSVAALGDVHSLAHNANLGVEAADGLSIGSNNSAIKIGVKFE